MAGKRVLVGLSGGLDSSYTAYLLIKQGYQVVGIHFSNGLTVDHSLATVKQVANYLDIPLIDLDLHEQFTQLLDAVEIEICHQQTPNICVKCAKEIKFTYVLNYALSHGFDYIATGHYVRIEPMTNGHGHGHVSIRMALDKTRDQSYGFSVIPNSQLQYVLTPLGQLRKVDIRQHANILGLPFISKESRGLCFTSLPFSQFYAQRSTQTLIAGHFMCRSQEVRPHQGQQLYTRGQKITSGNKRYYVNQKLPNGDISLATRDQLYQNSFTLIHINWQIDPQTLDRVKTYQIMIRYNTDPVECQIYEISKGKLRVQTSIPVYAPTEGQIGTVYDVDLVIVGGTICDT